MQIYFIRHGESTANKEKLYQGWTDVHLSIKGVEQAEKLNEYFLKTNIKFNNIYSSPLRRAVETAQPLLSSAFTEEVIKKKNLRSINVGEWSGIAIEYVRNKFQEEYWKWKNTPVEFQFPTGESINDVLIRSKCSLTTILDQDYSADVKIAIVTHMITIKVLIIWMTKGDLNNIWNPIYSVPNTGIVIFNVEKLENENKYRFDRVELKNPVPHLNIDL
jgi:broad specificity phosphatase PhoE